MRYIFSSLKLGVLTFGMGLGKISSSFNKSGNKNTSDNSVVSSHNIFDNFESYGKNKFQVANF